MKRKGRPGPTACGCAWSLWARALRLLCQPLAMQQPPPPPDSPSVYVQQGARFHLQGPNSQPQGSAWKRLGQKKVPPPAGGRRPLEPLKAACAPQTGTLAHSMEAGQCAGTQQLSRDAVGLRGLAGRPASGAAPEAPGSGTAMLQLEAPKSSPGGFKGPPHPRENLSRHSFSQCRHPKNCWLWPPSGGGEENRWVGVVPSSRRVGRGAAGSCRGSGSGHRVLPGREGSQVSAHSHAL